MWRELRVTLALLVVAFIMVVAFIVASPLIFAEPSAVPLNNYNYLAMVLHLIPTATATVVPSATPIPTATLPVPPTPTKRPTVGPTATPTLPPPSYNNCQADPNPNAAPNYPIQITSINKSTETVTLKNISTNAIDLTGWNMCSVTGNQHHPIGGTLVSGASQSFINTGGPIWNNASADPGALYNPAGQLVSYFNS